jgi:hypothetical protein
MKVKSYLQKYGNIVVSDKKGSLFYADSQKKIIGGMRKVKDIKRIGLY